MGLCEKTQSTLDRCTWIWLGEWIQAGKHAPGYYPGELPKPSKAVQISNSRKTENSTKILLNKSNPRHTIIRYTRIKMKEKMLRASQRERSGHLQRKANHTHSRSLSRNPTRQKRVGANIQHPQRKELSTQNLISSQTKLYKWRRNEILYRQAIIERFCHHLPYKSSLKKH